MIAIVHAATHSMDTVKAKIKEASKQLETLVAPTGLSGLALSLGGGQSATHSILEDMKQRERARDREMEQQERARQAQQREQDREQQEQHRRMIKERNEKRIREMEKEGITLAREPSKDSGMSR